MKRNVCQCVVYTEFESDHTGAYTVILGYQVKDLKNIPEGLKGVSIPASKYVILTTQKGKLANVVMELWKFVWTKWNRDQKYVRAYKADFEEYGLEASDPDNGRTTIYISIK